MTKDEEEQRDIENEAEVWRRWNDEGRKTDCFGLVARTTLLLLVTITLLWRIVA